MRFTRGVILGLVVAVSVGAQPPAGVPVDVLQEATINPDDLARMLEAAPDDPAFRGRILTQIADYHLTAQSLDDYNQAVEDFLANWPEAPADSVAALGQAVLLRTQMTTALAVFSKDGPDPRLTANDLATARFAAELAASFTPRAEERDKAVFMLETLAERFKTQRRGYAERMVVQRLYDLHPEPEARKPYLMRLSHLSMQYFRDVATSARLVQEWADAQDDPEQRAIFEHAAAVCHYLNEDYGAARTILDRLFLEAPASILPRVGETDILVKVRTGEFDAAQQAITARIAEGQVPDIEAHFLALRAYIHAVQGQRADAVTAFDALLKTHPTSRFVGTVKRILHALTEEPPMPVATPTPAGASSNIVLISLDTIRPDFLGCYGGGTTPAIDALAASGTVFEKAYSTSSWTKAAHGSVFSGLLPYAHGAMGHRDALAAGTTLLQENLRDAGYTTAGVVSAPPLNRLYGFARGFDVYDDFTFDLDRTADLFRRGNAAKVKIHSGRTGSLVTDAAVQALRQVRQPGHPFLLFVNYFDAHHNYEPAMPYSLEASKDYYGYHWGDVDELQMADRPFEAMRPFVEAERLRTLYAAEVRMVDDQVARLVAQLKESGAYDNTIFVLFSDHGEEFLEHGYLTHGKSLYEEVLRVPLILAGPGIAAGARVDTPVSLTDIAPTLLAQVGAPALRDADVPTLFAPEIERTIQAQLELPGYRMESILRDGVKLIRDREGATKELFDLNDDPTEAQDLSDDRATRVAEMTVELDRVVTASRMLGFRLAGGTSTEARGPAESLDALEEQLRAMGYLSGEAQTRAEPEAPIVGGDDLVVADFYEQPPGTFNAILRNDGPRDATIAPTGLALPKHGAPVHTWWMDAQPKVLAPGAQGVLRFALMRAKDAPEAFALGLDGRERPLSLTTGPAAWLPRYGVVDADAGRIYFYLDNPGAAPIALDGFSLNGQRLEIIGETSALAPDATTLVRAQTSAADTIPGPAILSNADTARAVYLYATDTPRFAWEVDDPGVFECPTHKHGPFEEAAQAIIEYRDAAADGSATVHFCRNRLPAGLAAFAGLTPRLWVNPVAANLARGTAEAWSGYNTALSVLGARSSHAVWTMVLDDSAPMLGGYGVSADADDPVIELDDARAVAYLALAAGAKGVVARARDEGSEGAAVLGALLEELAPLEPMIAVGAPADTLLQELPEGFVARVLQCADRGVLVAVLREGEAPAPLRIRVAAPEGTAYRDLQMLGADPGAPAPEVDLQTGTISLPAARRVTAFLLTTE